MDYRITVRLESRRGPKDRFKLMLKSTGPTTTREDTHEDRALQMDLYYKLALENQRLEMPGRKLRINEIRASLGMDPV